MTLFAVRDEREPENVTVQCTYGPTVFRVTEHEGHIASFWSELGRLLAQSKAHAEARAMAGYDRHTAGSAYPVPAWENLEQEERDHWIGVFSG